MKHKALLAISIIPILLFTFTSCNKTDIQVSSTNSQPIEASSSSMPSENLPTPTSTPEEPIKIVYVDANQNISAAITDKGDLYIWGNGESRPIKVMENIQSVSLGNDFVMVLTNEGEVFAWGDNSHGQIGNGDSETQLLYEENPVKVMEGVTQIDAGYDHALAIAENGDLYVWGDNSSGAVGNGNTQKGYGHIKENIETVPVKILSDVKQAAAGHGNTFAVTNEGELYAWGWNDYGTIGNGEKSDSQTFEDLSLIEPTKIMSNINTISVNFLTASAVSQDNELYVWGDNRYTKLLSAQEQSSDSYEIEEILQSPLKISDDAVQASFGILCSYVDKNSNLYVWGNNEFGSVGNGKYGDLNYETEDAFVNEPQKVISNIVQYAVSGYSILAVTQNGSLYAWGTGGSGQLGTGLKSNESNSTVYFESKPVLIEFDPSTESELEAEQKIFDFDTETTDISLNGNKIFNIAVSDNQYVYMDNYDTIIKIDMENKTYEDINIRFTVGTMIAAKDGNIYYYNNDNIVCMKADGTGSTSLYQLDWTRNAESGGSMGITDAYMNDKYIFFNVMERSSSFTKSYTYRIDLNHENLTLLTEAEGYLILTAVDDKYLYFEYKGFRTDLNGDNRENYDFLTGAQNLIFVNDWIYYIENIWTQQLYKVQQDGTQLQLININTSCFNIVGDKIYYANSLDENKLYVSNLDGSDSTKILDIANISGIDICAGRLFINYYNLIEETKEGDHLYREEREIFCISTMPDGSEIIEFPELTHTTHGYYNR